MKKLNNKEKKFAEILSDLNLEINTDEIWDAVEHRLPEKSDSRKPPFWLWGSAILFILGAIVFTQMFVSSESIIIDQKLSDLETENSNVLLQRSAEMEAAIDRVVAKKASEDQMFSENVETTIETEERSAIPGNTSIAISPDQNVENSEKVAPTTLRKDSRIISPSDAESKVNKSTLVSTSSKTFVEKELLRNFSTLPLLTSYLVSDPTDLELNNPIVPVKVLRAPLSFYYQIGAGININMPSYDMPNNEGTFVNAFESNLPGMLGSFSIGLETGKGYRFFGGLRYMQLVNKYSNDSYSVSTSTANGTQYIDLDQEGFYTEVDGEIYQKSERQNDIDWHRQFHNLDIHLGVGKRFLGIGDWSVALDASIHYNLISGSKGYVFADDFNGIKKYPEEISNPHGLMGLGGNLSLQLERKISEQFSIFCAPFYSTYFNKINTDSFYKTNSSQAGLQLGLRFNPQSFYTN